MEDTTPRVTGIGGIFFRSENPSNLNAWYGKHLGLAIDDYGSPFEFRNANQPDQINYLRWSPFEKNTKYLQPSEKDFMINYRVYNLEGLVRNMKNDSIEFLDEITNYDYGKFIHLIDPEGNKLELWEPNDAFLTTLGGKTTK
ncbi:MAG: VOC family protein [Crocinitomicaceae bacterium]|nr:VOC family protein [Crocinitomicaceae bacterium]MBK8925317.1 VOC family protein [Crocinitomicaceae bacterium]